MGCLCLATPLSGRPVSQFVIAGVLLGVGVPLWVINRLIVGRVSTDPERIGTGPVDRG